MLGAQCGPRPENLGEEILSNSQEDLRKMGTWNLRMHSYSFLSPFFNKIYSKERIYFSLSWLPSQPFPNFCYWTALPAHTNKKRSHRRQESSWVTFSWSILETRYSWFSACHRHHCCIGLDFRQQTGLHCSAKEAVYKIWESVGMTKAARYECDTSLHTHSLTGILFLLSGKRPISLIGCPSKPVYQLGNLQF